MTNKIFFTDLKNRITLEKLFFATLIPFSFVSIPFDTATLFLSLRCHPLHITLISRTHLSKAVGPLFTAPLSPLCCCFAAKKRLLRRYYIANSGLDSSFGKSSQTIFFFHEVSQTYDFEWLYKYFDSDRKIGLTLLSSFYC